VHSAPEEALPFLERLDLGAPPRAYVKPLYLDYVQELLMCVVFRIRRKNIPPQLKNGIVIRHYPSNVKCGLKRLFGSRLQGPVVLERLFGGVLLAGLFARSRTLSA